MAPGDVDQSEAPAGKPVWTAPVDVARRVEAREFVAASIEDRTSCVENRCTRFRVSDHRCRSQVGSPTVRPFYVHEDHPLLGVETADFGPLETVVDLAGNERTRSHQSIVTAAGADATSWLALRCDDDLESPRHASTAS